MIDQTISIRAPGKIILCGEYALLEGYSGTVAAVNKYVTTTISPSESAKFIGLQQKMCPVICDNNTGFISLLSNDKDLDIIKACFKICQENNLTIPLGDIYIDSKQLYFDTLQKQKIGLGSSAAVVVSLIGAIFYANHKKLVKKEIFSLALQTYTFITGKRCSGADLAASTFGKIISYQRQNNEKALINYQPKKTVSWENILVIFTGESQSTIDFVAAVNRLKSTDYYNYKKVIDKIANNASSIQKCLANYSDKIFALFSQYNQLISQLSKLAGINIFSTSIHTIVELSAKYDVACKPCGAGGGDIVICMGDKNNLSHLTKVLKKNHFHPLNLSIDECGVVAV